MGVRPEQWFRRADAVTRDAFRTAPWDWLDESASLTERVRRVCAAAFELRVLAESWRPLAASDAARMACRPVQRALVREVALVCGATPFVYALSVMPESTVRTHPWLAELGQRPLGELLFDVADLSREPFEVARLGRGDALFAAATHHLGGLPEPLWARRSVVRLSAVPLLINECFLPAVLACPST